MVRIFKLILFLAKYLSAPENPSHLQTSPRSPPARLISLSLRLFAGVILLIVVFSFCHLVFYFDVVFRLSCMDSVSFRVHVKCLNVLSVLKLIKV